MSESLLKLYKGLSGEKTIIIKPMDAHIFNIIINDLYNNFWHNNDFLNIDFSDYRNYTFYIYKREYTEFYETQYIVRYGINHKTSFGEEKNVFEKEFFSDEKYQREKQSSLNLFKRILNKHIKKCNYEIIDNN